MAPGTRIGTVIENKYRLDEQIGHGGTGAVYRGTQLAVDRPVAVKLLHPNYVGHKKLQARFEVEARAIARLNHPNCITLFDFGYSDSIGAFYTIVEYIDGVPLYELIPQNPSVKRVIEVIRQIASALGHAHHHGILHRDLKPENIMLARMTDGTEMVKVLDFGIAQIMKGDSGDDEDDGFEADRLTRVGEVFGTPPYMSPEQARSSRDLTPASDIYSLGIIFYELLEGRLPFLADSPMEILGMHMHDPPPGMVRAGLSEPVKSIVLQMLAKDPEQRPRSGTELMSLLDRIPARFLEESRHSVKIPLGEMERPEKPTLLLPDKEESSDILEEQTLVTSFAYEQADPGSAGRGVVPWTRPATEPRAVGPEAEPVNVEQRETPPLELDTLVLPEDLPSPKTVFLRDEPNELKEVRQRGTNRNLVVLLSLILIGMLIAVFWVFTLGGAASDDPMAPGEEGQVISPEAPTVEGTNPERFGRGRADEPTSVESSEAVREIPINQGGNDVHGGSNQAREATAPPPPTRPATQRRLQEKQNQEEPETSRSARRTRRPATMDTRGAVREDEEEDDNVRRPVRMGL